VTLMLDLIVSVVALTILEIVLGIDNLIFLSIMVDKLPEKQRARARFWGLSCAWVARLVLLSLSLLLVKLTTPLVQFLEFSFSARDIFLFLGGAFLIVKATQEIHDEMNQTQAPVKTRKKYAQIGKVIIQIVIMDLIFSLDSVLTAIGLTNNFWIMFIGITIAIIIMLYASKPVSLFIERYPAIKVLALSYLILIGMLLVADGLSFHVPRGYLYCAMGFSLMVEALNIRRGTRS
jgi:predicted tellurium resistance membrane protein TerC